MWICVINNIIIIIVITIIITIIIITIMITIIVQLLARWFVPQLVRSFQNITGASKTYA